MSIASGYKKFKKYILTSSGFQLVSHWTKANTLEFDDGKTAQDKLGAIDGISSSRESNSDKIAASTALVSELNSDLGGFSFKEEAGIKYVRGADSVWVPFKMCIRDRSFRFILPKHVNFCLMLFQSILNDRIFIFKTFSFSVIFREKAAESGEQL